MPRLNRTFVAAMLAREWRSSRRRLLLYGASMALGVAVLVGLEGLRETTARSIDDQAARLLGGDLRLSRRAALPPDVVERVTDLLARTGGTSVAVTRFGSMAAAPGGIRTRLVDVQAVGDAYPLRGAVLTTPPDAWAQIHTSARPSAVVDTSLLLQLGIDVGDGLTLGASEFRVVGTVTRAPGSFGMQTQIAPRVFIPRRAVEATGLVRAGSLVEHLLFVRAPTDAVTAWVEQNRTALEDAHTRAQTVAGQREELQRGFGMMTRFLGLVGLAALALGGVGVAAGVRVLVREKLDTTALLRSVGASSGDVGAIYGLLAVALGAVAGGFGAILGVLFQWALPVLLGGLMPIEVDVRLEWAAVGRGLVLGVWVTLLAAAAPLIDLVRIPPLRSLRADFTAEPLPRAGRLVVALLVAVSLTLVALAHAPTLAIGFGFAAGLGAALLLFAAAARLLAVVVRRRVPRASPYWLRQGLANLFRPRNHTVSSVLTVGFGLFLITTLHGVGSNLRAQLALDADAERPNLILFDVQADQSEPLEAFLAARGAFVIDRAPIVSARLSAVDGQPVSGRIARDPDDREARWALLREYRLSYAGRLRESESIAAGAWWTAPEAGDAEPLPVSLESGIADALQVQVGDALTWDVQGVPVQSLVASIRQVDWSRFTTNFIALFPPGLIEQAPRTIVFLAYHPDERARAVLQRDLVRDFPNVSALDAALLLRAVDTLMGRIAVAVRALAAFAVVTGFLVLLAAATLAREERLSEMRLLRTLGASSGVLRRIATTEAVALGALAASLGTALAVLACALLAVFVFEVPFAPPWRDFALLALASFAASSFLGGVLGSPRPRAPAPPSGPA